MMKKKSCDLCLSFQTHKEWFVNPILWEKDTTYSGYSDNLSTALVRTTSTKIECQQFIGILVADILFTTNPLK